MILDPALVLHALRWLLCVIYAAALAWALIAAPWRKLSAVPMRFHLLLGSAVGLAALWSIAIRLPGHPGLHLIGVTAVTLVLGAALALVAGSLALLFQMVLGQTGWMAAAMQGALDVLLPVLVTEAVLLLAVRYGPRNLYVYLLGVGFLGGALSMLAAYLCVALLLWFSVAPRALDQWSLALSALLAFPEGFINGAVVSGLAVYVPGWLKTFDDRHFLSD